MAALRRLRATVAHELFFHYYGEDSEHVEDEARKHGVEHRVVLHGKVCREEALSALRGADISVVITSVSAEERPEDNGMIPAKLYESLGLGNRVLLLAPKNSDARKILDETGCGRSFTATEIDGVASYIDEVIGNRQDVRTSPELYSWPHIAKHLDERLRTIVCDTAKNGLRAAGSSQVLRVKHQVN
jgi:glycosyltransferase involved in cell wall biosynthesis